MPSGFDAIALTPQTTNDLGIVFTQYSGSVAPIFRAYDTVLTTIFEVAYDGVIQAGGGINLLPYGQASSQSLVASTAFASQFDTLTLPQTHGNVLVTGDYATGALTGGRKIALVNLTNQSADISSTNLTKNALPGMYMVWASLEDTSADVTAGVVTLSVGYTDDAGATTNTATTQTLVATGRATLALPLYVASGDVTFSTSHTGIFGTA